MRPRVSVCVPNLNTRPFLPERFRTIREQSLRDWELLVYDSFSTDGAWEYLQALAAEEPRMRVWQGPREGTPASWNPCVKAARGEYVYIATSDDTMAPDCLERLVAALDAHPECDIAHCTLRPIDERGETIASTYHWWARASAFAVSSGSWLHRPHVRRAPFDGLLHLEGGSVYVSITQLLVRRSLFDDIGYFESTWGSVGDFDWSMRAGLVANTVHVPDTWGGWRVHGGQATAGVRLGSDEHARRIDAMIEHAVAVCAPRIAPAILEALESRWLPAARARRALARDRARRSPEPVAVRGAYLLGRALAGSAAARECLEWRVRRRSFAAWLRSELEAAGCGPALVPAVPAGGLPSTIGFIN
jgi:GT2 family glycosyltransferase